MENPQSPDTFGPKQYTYEQLAEATHKFSNKYLLGEGGFGQVYEGSLDGKTFAIKKLRYLPDQLEHEIRVVSGISHRNLVKLVGYCIEAQERNALLVLEYFPKKSLKVNLHNEEAILDWPTRMKIAKGTAKGLQYLHEDCETKIIHQDIKPDNILLDNNFEPKIADFGLALVFPDHNTHISTSTVGTEVYRERSKKVSDKSDVYSFGVVLLELITGRKPIHEDIDIIAWARTRILQALKDENEGFVDSNLHNYNEREMKRMIYCAGACVYNYSEFRPPMKKVLQTLEGDTPLPNLRDEKIDNKKDPFPMGVSETSSSAAGAGPFDVLRNSPEFQAFRDMVQANPHLLQPMLQEWEKENPPLWRLIQENRAEFLRLINEPSEGRHLIPYYQVIRPDSGNSRRDNFFPDF